MARTKASVGTKVSSGKSSKARCTAAPAAPSRGESSGSSTSSRSAGNSVCPRETPGWQKPITRFFCSKEGTPEKQPASGETAEHDSPQKASRPRRANVSSSDDDEEEPPRNQELEESIVLEPLAGDSSRKMNEYYTSAGKGKGVGKKTNKENIDNNAGRDSGKRDLELEEIASGDEARASKRVKVN